MGLRHWERRLATGANAALVAVLVLVGLGLAVDVVERVGPRWDLTLDGAASLRPQTRAVLERVDAAGLDVRLTAFSAQQKDALAASRDRQLQDVLRVWEQASPRIRTTFVDFDRDRLTAERMGVDRYGTVVLEARGDRVDLADRELFRRSGSRDARTVDFVGEAALAAALEQLLAADSRTVYALTGHGEKVPFDRGLGDLHGLAGVLDGLGLRTRTLDLLGQEGPPEVPADAAAVLVIGPTAPLPPVEQDALRAYLRDGGGVAICVEPGAPVPELLDELGLLRPEGVAMDPRSLYPWEDRPLLVGRRHPITEGVLADGLAVVAGHAAPLQIVPVDGVRANPVLGTSREGWVERGEERPARYDAGVDVEGPVEVAVTAHVGRGRLLLVGDADWLGDPLIDEGPGNGTFAAASVRWLIGDAVGVARVDSGRVARRVALTPAQLSRVRIGLVLVWPLLLLGVGAGWLAARRRR